MGNQFVMTCMVALALTGTANGEALNAHLLRCEMLPRAGTPGVMPWWLRNYLSNSNQPVLGYNRPLGGVGAAWAVRVAS